MYYYYYYYYYYSIIILIIILIYNNKNYLLYFGYSLTQNIKYLIFPKWSRNVENSDRLRPARGVHGTQALHVPGFARERLVHRCHVSAHRGGADRGVPEAKSHSAYRIPHLSCSSSLPFPLEPGHRARRRRAARRAAGLRTSPPPSAPPPAAREAPQRETAAGPQSKRCAL